MLKTFSIGGVHPHENKLSAHQPIITAEVPAKAVILLGQHIGAPAKPIVAKGDVVKVGTKIAEPAGFVSAAIHSSVSGKVAKIDTIVDASGYAKPAIFIDVEGDEWEETIDRSATLVKECELSSEEIVKKIAEAGIVGLGGACFPTQVKLCPPPSFKAECVIINAVECEPYLTADHQLMLEHAEEIMVGVSILMKAVKVNKAFIGIENNKPDAIELMTKVASGYAGIEVVPLKVKYPQGGEKQLIDAITKRQVASGALPISTGAVVQNVGTAFAVYQAVQKNKPLFERVITVTGKSVAKPSNFLARIGTPMKQLIDACGGLPEDTGKTLLSCDNADSKGRIRRQDNGPHHWRRRLYNQAVQSAGGGRKGKDPASSLPELQQPLAAGAEKRVRYPWTVHKPRQPQMHSLRKRSHSHPAGVFSAVVSVR